MIITSEADIAKLIESDPWMMKVLRAAENFDLPDWWIGAGFLRSKIWDAIEGKHTGPTKDVDLVYFNATETAPETDWAYDEKMKHDFPFAEWEVRNQARMHYVDDFSPYTSTADGISHWVETATCVAVKLHTGKLTFLFCHGTDDLYGLIARPIPIFKQPELIEVFYNRVSSKRWQEKWPHLRIETT
ncbi:nucleotidyltransferase family protein [Candidatus Saccharibacteria bacterium]|nr:nucleotidyltransferase family protein [Candidatus Saccharibacteria bacterium]